MKYEKKNANGSRDEKGQKQRRKLFNRMEQRQWTKAKRFHAKIENENMHKMD